MFQFTKSVFTVTGKDLEVFIDQWVYKSGCAYFNGNFVFNRKRNVVELELKQELTGKGILKYVVSKSKVLVDMLSEKTKPPRIC